LGDARAIEPLISLLNERQSTAAAKALGQIGDSRAVEPLLTALQTVTGYGQHDIIAAWGSFARRGYADPRAFEMILQTVNDAKFQVRNVALRALGYFGDARAIPVLRAALGEKPDRDEGVHNVALHALGRLGDTETRDLLQAVLEDQTGDPTTRTQAARWLGWFGDPTAVLPLVMALNEDTLALRLQAIESLGWLRDARAVDPLLALLNDHHPTIRFQAAQSLGKIGDVRAIDALIALLNDEERLPFRVPVMRVSNGAYGALKTLGTPEAVAAAAAWRKREAGGDGDDVE
jgi:HEAT repeat protein